MTNKLNVSALRDRLVEKREEIQSLRDISRESQNAVELDQTSVGRLSRMDALQGQAMAQATERQREADLALIESALQRIDDGDYGRCVVCDEEIAPKRLASDPAVATCINCAK